MAKLSVLNQEGKETDKIDLPDEIFAKRVNTNVLHQAIVMYRANARQGTVSTKERKEVRGGGKKPYRQKGTGRARAGSIRSPLWIGGGVTFGPKPRDFGYDVPRKVRRVALRESLNAKFRDKQMICLDDIKEKIEKTKDFAKILKTLKLEGKTLAVLDGCDSSIQRSSRNIAKFRLVRSQDVNAFEVLQNKNLLISRSGVKAILERVKK